MTRSLQMEESSRGERPAHCSHSLDSCYSWLLLFEPMCSESASYIPFHSLFKTSSRFKIRFATIVHDASSSGFIVASGLVSPV